MEPSPSTFLRAIRREISSDNLFGDGLRSGESRVNMMRAAECLAQLVFRHEDLPGLLRTISARQAALLTDIAGRLQAAGWAVPPSFGEALDDVAARPAEAGEADIRLYDRLVDASCDGIRELRAAAVESAAVLEICQRACAVEAEMRVAYANGLERLKQQIDAAPEAAPALPPPSEAALTDYLRARLPGEPGLQVSNLRRLAGDNSKDIFFFDLTGSATLDGAYVMRREPAFNATGAKLIDEFEIMGDLKANGVPAPSALIGEGDPRPFGGGFIITRRVPGVPRSARDLGPDGPAILKEIAGISARIHAMPVAAGRAKFQGPSALRDRMLARIDLLYRRWLSEKIEDSVVLEAAYAWLHANVDRLGDLGVVTHGDFNLRNILLDGADVSAVLDWELACISHPAEDVAYIRSDVEQVMAWDGYLREYHRHAAYEITPEALEYFSVWIEFWRAMTGASCFSGYRGGRHASFLYATTIAVEYPPELRKMAAILGRG